MRFQQAPGSIEYYDILDQTKGVLPTPVSFWHWREFSRT